MPSNASIALNCICESIGTNIVEFLTHPSTVKNSTIIVIAAFCTAYFCHICKDFSKNEFKSINDLLNTLFKMFHEKIEILKKPVTTANNNLVFQQVDNINIQTKQLIDKFEPKNMLLKKKLVIFLERVIKLIKEA